MDGRREREREGEQWDRKKATKSGWTNVPRENGLSVKLIKTFAKMGSHECDKTYDREIEGDLRGKVIGEEVDDPTEE